MGSGSTRTVVYDRWFVEELARGERRRAEQRGERRRPPVWPAIDKREPDPRAALALAADRRGVALAALSRMIDRPARYLDRFVREGVPRALSAEEHTTLAAFFGVDERALGVRQLWKPM